MNYKLEAGPGDRFQEVSERAKRISVSRNNPVEFNFNEIVCVVNSDTNLELLYKDYCNAHIMEWKTVGPMCNWDYDADTQIELYTRKLERAKSLKKSQEEMNKKDALQSEAVSEKTKGVELKIRIDKKDQYADYVANNSKDGYSKAVIEYAEVWAKIMQTSMQETGKPVAEIADESQKGLGYFGITGFQYGCAVQGLSQFWEHGEDLRKWHNKEWGVSEEAKGVANPAVFTLNS